MFSKPPAILALIFIFIMIWLDLYVILLSREITR